MALLIRSNAHYETILRCQKVSGLSLIKINQAFCFAMLPYQKVSGWIELDYK